MVIIVVLSSIWSFISSLKTQIILQEEMLTNQELLLEEMKRANELSGRISKKFKLVVEFNTIMDKANKTIFNTIDDLQNTNEVARMIVDTQNTTNLRLQELNFSIEKFNLHLPPVKNKMKEVTVHSKTTLSQVDELNKYLDKMTKVMEETNQQLKHINISLSEIR